jgi:hypothetical protein
MNLYKYVKIPHVLYFMMIGFIYKNKIFDIYNSVLCQILIIDILMVLKLKVI